MVSFTLEPLYFQGKSSWYTLTKRFGGYRAGQDVVTEEYLKMTVFWDAAPCSLVEIYLCFIGACLLYHKGDESLP
jgi:hypothetical protein